MERVWHNPQVVPAPTPFPRPGHLARGDGGVNGGLRHRRATPLGAIDSDGVTNTILAEGAVAHIQGFSDYCRSRSWIVVISYMFRYCKRSSSAVVIGYLRVCDRKVSNRSWPLSVGA